MFSSSSNIQQKLKDFPAFDFLSPASLENAERA